MPTLTPRAPGDKNVSEFHEGGCLCGNVRFRAAGAPLRTLACHCRFCQRVTGSSYYAESMYLMDAVQFNDVAISRYTHASESSGKAVYVHFCPKCGTTVSLTFERWPEYRAISRGAFDEPNRMHISSHIWTESAQSGVALPPKTDCFRRARMKLNGESEIAQVFDTPTMAREI